MLDGIVSVYLDSFYCMKKVLIIALLIIGIGALVWWMQKDGGGFGSSEPQIPEDEALTILFEFYNPWLDAAQSTSTDPYAEGLAEAPMLSDEVRQYIADHREDDIDPVLCQEALPRQIGARPLYEEDLKAQYMLLSRGLPEQSPRYAVATLDAVDGEWRITSIACQFGEEAPEREFSFMQEGQLLKSVPPPLDSNYWHLVFTQSGVEGHTVPLFFDENSTCINEQGETSVCDESQFQQTARATVKGDMTEAGVEVKEMQF